MGFPGTNALSRLVPRDVLLVVSLVSYTIACAVSLVKAAAERVGRVCGPDDAWLAPTTDQSSSFRDHYAVFGPLCVPDRHSVLFARPSGANRAREE